MHFLNPSTIRRQAEAMQVSYEYAARCRIRFAMGQAISHIESGDEVWINQGNKMLDGIAKLMQTLVKRPPVEGEQITDDMLMVARAYPIQNLITFYHGKAHAFCHDDKHPSLFHGTRSNRAVCPVCDLKFDPIAVLVDRDGMDFKDAVKNLCNR